MSISSVEAIIMEDKDRSRLTESEAANKRKDTVTSDLSTEAVKHVSL